MDDLATRYRVRPSFSVVAHSADVIELRRGVWNPVSITLTDKGGSGKLLRALELMNGESTLEEIAARTALTKDEADNLVSFLTRYDAIETKPGSALDYQLELVRETLGAGTETSLSIERVVFLGGPGLAGEVAEQLAELEGPISALTAAPELEETLTGTDFTLVDDPLAFRREMARFSDWKDSLVVVASATIHPILLRNVNRVCLHHGIPWVHAAADGPYLIVGPTFVPRRSSCYECFETRVSLSMRESESYVRYKRALANRAIKSGGPQLVRPFRGVLASLAALEVANLAATGSNFTVGKALTVYLPTLEFSFNEVLRVPGCAACSPFTEQHEQSLYFDLKGYVNSIYAGNGSKAG